ncbi:uncharacterized protein LOC144987945 [Oryzias latipes]
MSEEVLNGKTTWIAVIIVRLADDRSELQRRGRRCLWELELKIGAGTMSSEPQEGSVREQLSAAEGTIVQNEEELCRQRRLLDSSWNPQLQLHIVVLPQHWMTEEEDLCNQQRNFRVEQEEPEPPQIQEEQEEPELPQIKEEQEEPEPPQIKEEQEEPAPPQIKEEQEEPAPPQIKEEPELPQIKEEQQSVNVTNSQDEEGNQHEESTSTTDEETDPQNRDQRKRRDRSHVQSVDSSRMSAEPQADGLHTMLMK